MKYDIPELLKRIQICKRMIGAMCQERRPPKMCIPAEHNEHNEDLFICDTFIKMEEYLKEHGVDHG